MTGTHLGRCSLPAQPVFDDPDVRCFFLRSMRLRWLTWRSVDEMALATYIGLKNDRISLPTGARFINIPVKL